MKWTNKRLWTSLLADLFFCSATRPRHEVVPDWRVEKRLDFRWEALNASSSTVHRRFREMRVTSAGPVPGSPSHFLNRDFTDSGIRSMWV
jgi:hypothetical protein